MEKDLRRLKEKKGYVYFCFLQRIESLKNKENEIRSLSELDTVVTSCTKMYKFKKKVVSLESLVLLSATVVDNSGLSSRSFSIFQTL